MIALIGLIAFETTGNNKSKGYSALDLLLIVLMFINLDKIENIIFNRFFDKLHIITPFLAALIVLVPLYRYIVNKINHFSILNPILGFLLALSIVLGIVTIVVISKNIGAYPMSYLFNSDGIKLFADQTSSVIICMITYVLWAIIKVVDLLIIIGFIPGMQLLIYYIIKRMIPIKRL